MKSALSTALSLILLAVFCIGNSSGRKCAKRDCTVSAREYNITTRAPAVVSSPAQFIRKRKKHHHKHKKGFNQLQQKSDQPFFPNKVGIAWGRDPGQLAQFNGQKIGMIYDWGASPWGAQIPADSRYCSMIWGWKTAEQYKQQVTDQPDAEQNKDRCTFGPNEVNIGSQSQMSPESACQLMRQYVMPLKAHGYKVGLPSTTQSPDGIEWMKRFRDGCRDVWDQSDWSTLHFYEVKFEWFTDYVNRWHNEFGKDIIITEMAAHSFGGSPQLDGEGVKQFTQQVADYVAKTPWILNVAWTGYDNGDDWVNKMVTDEGKPNSLFQTFSSILA